MSRSTLWLSARRIIDLGRQPFQADRNRRQHGETPLCETRFRADCDQITGSVHLEMNAASLESLTYIND